MIIFDRYETRGTYFMSIAVARREAPSVGRPAARGPAFRPLLCLLLLALPELLESRFALTGFKHAGRTIEGQVARSAL